jgi:RimJ/RimL family protein N-acetyltransferase
MKIQFEKASLKHLDTIFKWLSEPHMMEFWDNSQEHKEDILNFIHERKQHYFYGTTMYWVASIDNEPFCFILSDILKSDQNLPDVHKKYMSEKGHTISLDFGIGNKKFLGKGLAAPTLEAFVNFYNTQIDTLADTFFIDPDENNPRAKHVYAKAGFIQIGEFDVSMGVFKGSVSYLMVKKIYK